MELSVKQSIVDQLKNYMDEHNLKASDVAKRTNINPAYLSIILKESSNFMYTAGGKSGFINNSNFYSIAKFIDYSLIKAYWQTQPTDQMKAALANLQDAKEFGQTSLIIAETGSGKSYVSQMFANKNPHDTFIIKVSNSDNLGDLLDKAIEVLNIPTAKSKSGKLRAITKQLDLLKSQGYFPQIIWDEAEYMKQPTLCAMKELHDALNGSCSIVLIGTQQLLDNLEKLRKRNKPGIPQFYRRIKFAIRVLPQIDRSFALFISDLPISLQTFLKTHCDNYGELHDVLVPALREADRLDEPVSEELVRKVLGMPEKRKAA